MNDSFIVLMAQKGAVNNHRRQLSLPFCVELFTIVHHRRPVDTVPQPIIIPPCDQLLYRSRRAHIWTDMYGNCNLSETRHHSAEKPLIFSLPFPYIICQSDESLNVGNSFSASHDFPHKALPPRPIPTCYPAPL